MHENFDLVHFAVHLPDPLTNNEFQTFDLDAKIRIVWPLFSKRHMGHQNMAHYLQFEETN